MEAFVKAHQRLMNTPSGSVHRKILEQIDPTARLVCIRGSRGIGKTTILLDYARSKYSADSGECLYLNLNHFYFAEHSVYGIASIFYMSGGRLLLVDQVFKYPQWKEDLLHCLQDFPELRIIFTASSVMTIEEDYPELKDKVKVYDLKGFSFREYINYKNSLDLKTISLDELLSDHVRIAADIVNTINPMKDFEAYLKNGYFPPQGSSLLFEENLVKNMNILLEVDVVYIRQIEPSYLHKLRELFYLVASQDYGNTNISSLSEAIGTSRATVMNYLKYLADAELIRLIYKEGMEYPRKPNQIMPHNTSVASVLYPYIPSAEVLRKVFFFMQVEGAGYDAKLVQSYQSADLVLEGKHRIRLTDMVRRRTTDEDNSLYAVDNLMVGRKKEIPLWLFGFLY